MPRVKRGVYPGSFNPLTIAHLGVATAAKAQRGLDVVHLAISVVALDKEHVAQPSVEQRISVIEASVAAHPWVEVVTTEAQLLADISIGYDTLILGGDKWAQVNELRFYDSPAHMDECLDALPELAIAPRAGVPIPEQHLLDVDPKFADISSSAVRSGREEWTTDAARESGLWDLT